MENPTDSIKVCLACGGAPGPHTCEKAGHEDEIIFHHIEISRTAYHKGLHRGLKERAKEIGGLKALVREMAFADYTQFTEILNRPEVRAIMEEE